MKVQHFVYLFWELSTFYTFNAGFTKTAKNIYVVKNVFRHEFLSCCMLLVTLIFDITSSMNRKSVEMHLNWDVNNNMQ